MELFIDKYKPKTFEDIGFSEHSNERLINLSKAPNMPHLILRGTYGSGKRSRVLLFLKEKFGPSVYKLRTHIIEASVPNKKDPIPLQILVSPYHYQFNPSFHGVYDRVLIQKFIDEIVKYKIVTNIPYRIIVLEDTDLLTFEAQQSLRRTLETRIKNCRFIFLVNQVGHLIDPIYSRCIVVNVSAPTIRQTERILSNIVKSEGLSVNPKLLTNIARQSERNITNAIHNLQKIIVKDKAALSKDTVALNDDIAVADEIIKLLISANDLTVFVDIRKKINELFIHNIPATKILNMLFKRAIFRIPKTETQCIYNIAQFASDYDNSIRLGGKFIYHIEVFCLRFFREIKELMSKRRITQPKATKIKELIKNKPSVVIKKTVVAAKPAVSKLKRVPVKKIQKIMKCDLKKKG